MKRTLVTSALPYANGPIHIGHLAGAYLPADIYTRYKRLKGEDVIHICGTDEHGVAITIAAEKEGVTPRELADRYYEIIKKGFEGLGIIFDNFSRTSKPVHHRVSREFFLRIYEKGYIERKDTEQFYCPKCKRFLPDRYVIGTCPYCGNPSARGDQCEACGRWLEPVQLINPRCAICGSIPELRKTFHYYFKLGMLEERLRSWLEEKKDWKANVRNTALSWVKEGLQDRAITRDLEWGVKVPLEEAEGKVLYVWFDAPIGYISSTIEWAEMKGDPDLWKKYWLDPETYLVHFIGKDNIVFHAIVWPAMLMAHGDFVLPSQIPANEFLNLMGDKISTSRGWALWVHELLEEFPPDYIRFGIASILPETKDADFDLREFRVRVNSELADNIGNFVNRTLSFIKNYMRDRIPHRREFGPQEKELLSKIEKTADEIAGYLESFQMRKALRAVLDLSTLGNQYFDGKKPWATRKNDEEETARTLYTCTLLVKSLSVLMEPFLPFSAEKIRNMLGIEEKLSWEDAKSTEIPSGAPLGELKILYRKLEESRIEDMIQGLIRKARGKAPEGEKGTEEVMEETKKVSIDEFRKLDIRIGKIVEAEKVEGTKKLLKLRVDMGEKTITLVAGIAEYYRPEEIIGFEIPVIYNLEPAKIRGIESQGMLLAAVEDGKVVLLSPREEVKPGTRVS
ncbi:MAG: methionine--tRNA ligase [Candidatus Hydrothermae bacterium]|nr:methionine--tRNA ligase [Candidatus Hydrothermae bacterium]